jgi:hypothetical protein
MSVAANSGSCRVAIFEVGIDEGEEQAHLSAVSLHLAHAPFGEKRKVAAHVPERATQIVRIQRDIRNQPRLGQLDRRAQLESEARLSQGARGVLEQRYVRIEGDVRVRAGQLLTAESRLVQELGRR